MKSYEISVEIRADNIIKLRKLRKQSQTALAQKAGVSKQYISLIELGKQKNVSNTIALKISQVLSVEPTEICIGYIEPKEEKENLLTEKERVQFAEMYFPCLRVTVLNLLKHYTFDFEESYSIALLVLAQALFTFKKARNCSFQTYLDRAINNALKNECTKQNTQKRKGYTISLDEFVDNQEDDSYGFNHQIPSSFNLEDYVCSRLGG